MKIDAVSGYPVYHKNSSALSPKANPSASGTNRTDVVDFSRSQGAVPEQDDKNLTLRAAILRDAAQPKGVEEIAALKSSVRSGAYHRSTEELVNAIMGLDADE